MKTIEGILGIPRVSRNKRFYFPEELAKGHNIRVPLRWEHIKESNGIIGEALLIWDNDLMQLRYRATVDNPQIEAMLESKNFQVSLGLSAEETQQICHDVTKTCYESPINVTFKEMSIVEVGGIPESTLDVVEKFTRMIATESVTFEALHQGTCPPNQHMVDGKCVPITVNSNTNTSNSNNETKNQVMTEKPSQEDTIVSVKSTTPEVTPTVPTTQVPETPIAPAQVAPATVAPTVPNPVEPKVEPIVAPATVPTVTPQVAEAPCAPGCTPTVAPKPDADKPSVPTETICKDEVAKIVEAALVNERVAIQKTIAEKYEPKAEVSESVANAVSEEKFDEQVDLMKEVLAGKSISIKIDKDAFIESHTARIQGPFDEAVSTSGTIPGVDIGTQIVILPGGIKIKPIRQWVEVRKIPQGDDTVRFYTLDIPAFADITESPSTDITPATHTLTGIDLSANTVRGFRQNVLKSELERYPKQLLEKIRETARRRAIEDEASNILVTIAAADSADFGANHLGGDDGALETDETDEDAAAEFSATGIEAAKQRLEEQGHDPEDGGAVLALTPRAMKNLTVDSNLVRFVQTGDPTISRKGRMAMYFGVELFVTNTIRVSNNADRNICFIKGKAFGLAVGREIELEFDKNINRQSVDIVATHRINSVILDATAYVILSSKSD